MKIRLLSPVLFASMTLAACGGSAAPASTAPAPASSAAAATQSSAAPASSAAAAAQPSTAAPSSSAAPAKPSASAAASSAGAAASGPLKKVRVGLSVAQTFEFEPANIAASQGLDKQHGIQSDVTGFGGDAALQQAMAAGSIDVGLASSTASATAITKGSPIVIVGQIDDNPKFMCIIAGANSGITSADQLKGKTIGATSHGAFTEYVVQRLGVSKGWGQDGIKVVTLGGFAQQVAALKQKQDDGFVWTADGGLQMEKEGLGKIIFHADEIMPDLPFEVVIAQQKLVKENPQLVKAYVSSLFDAIKFMKSNKDKTLQLFAKDMGVPPDIAAKTYDDDISAMSETGKISTKGMGNLAQAITETKAVPKAPDPKTLYDAQFVGTK